MIKEFAAKEKLEIVLSAPVQGEAGGRGVWGESRPPSAGSSVPIFANRQRQLGIDGNVVVKPSLQTAVRISSAPGVPKEDVLK